MRLYDILDRFHCTDFWATERIRIALKKQRNEERRYAILARFLRKIAHHMPLDYFGGDFTGAYNYDDLEFKTWEDIDSGLEYFSDRWNLSRVLRVQTFIDYHKWDKLTKEQPCPK